MDSDIGATATLVQQQHQTLEGNHHQGQKEQDQVNGTVASAEGHAVDRFRGEAGCSAKEIAVVVSDNDSVGDSSTQCSDVIDDDNEEEKTDVEESGAGGWIMNPPVSTIIQHHQAFYTTNGYIALPNPDSSNFSDVRVKDSSNVHLGNEVNYNGPVTINQFVYTNSTPNQDAIELDVIRPSENISNLSTNKDNGAPNGCIFPQYTELNKVTQWLWTWKRAVLSCVITLILLAIVVPITVHFTHQSDASVSLEIPTSSNEGSFLPSVRPTTGTTRSPPTPAPTRPSGTPSGTNTCKAPPQPQNGRWKLHRSQCSDGQDCNVPEGTELGLGSHLVYSCDSGYKIRGSTDVSCNIEGKWLNIPVCTAILCKALVASSIRSKCLYNDEWISCKSPVPPKTKATLSCEKSYRPETNLLSGQRTNVRCNAYGEWEPEPMRCVPVCGTLPPDYKPTEYHVGDFRPNISEFPWHASMYVAELGKPKRYYCGASIIQENLLITAAQCVYDDINMQLVDANKIYILAGNLFRDYNNPFHNPLLVKRNQVKRIYVERIFRGFRGKYVSDIAVLELVTPFVFSSYLVPACIDTLNYWYELEPGTYGKVTGFGRTATGEASAVLQALTVPVISLRQCMSASQSIPGEFINTNDKICAGYTNGSNVCYVDSGGGLVFKTNNLWYLRGIVILSLDTIKEEERFPCNMFTLYTEISTHIPWIQDVIIKIEQYQTHTLCSEQSPIRCS